MTCLEISHSHNSSRATGDLGFIYPVFREGGLCCLSSPSYFLTLIIATAFGTLHTNSNVKKLEREQSFAARVVTNSWSHDNHILKSLNSSDQASEAVTFSRRSVFVAEYSVEHPSPSYPFSLETKFLYFTVCCSALLQNLVMNSEETQCLEEISRGKCRCSLSSSSNC